MDKHTDLAVPIPPTTEAGGFPRNEFMNKKFTT